MAAAVTYLRVPGLAGRRLAGARGGLGRAGQRHRAVRVHGPQVARRAGRGAERSRPNGRADLRRSCRRRSTRRAQLDRRLRGRAAPRSPRTTRRRSVQRRSSSSASAWAFSSRRSEAQYLAVARARRGAHGRRAPRVRSLAGRRRGRGGRPRRGAGRGHLAPGRHERSLHADSIPTFGSLLARARLLHPDPQSPSATPFFAKLLTAFFRPTIVYDPRRDRTCAAGAPAVGTDVKYTLRARRKDRRRARGRRTRGAREDARAAGRARTPRRRSAQREPSDRRRAVQHARAAIFGLTLLLFRPQLYASLRAVLLFAIVFLIVIVGVVGRRALPAARRIRSSFRSRSPRSSSSMLFDPRIGMVAAMVLAVLIGGQSEFRGTNALFLNLIGGTAAAFTRAHHSPVEPDALRDARDRGRATSRRAGDRPDARPADGRDRAERGLGALNAVVIGIASR